MSKWFEYGQNNSGGSWVPPYRVVWVQARTKRQANAIAQDEADVYFDGCDTGRDCPCCGDRWSEPLDDGGEDAPDLTWRRESTMRSGSLYAEVPMALLVHEDGRREEIDLTAEEPAS